MLLGLWGLTVPINAICPACKTRYTLKDEMRGQATRCPNFDCRKIFTVGGDEPPPPSDTAASPNNGPPPNKERRSRSVSGKSGSVGDMVPILPAEIPLQPEDEPVPAENQTAGQVGDVIPLLQGDLSAPSPSVATSWMDPPPVRRSTPAVPPAPDPAPPRPSKSTDTHRRRSAPTSRSRPASADPPPPEPVSKSVPVPLPPPEPEPPPVTNGPAEANPFAWETPPPIRLPGAAPEPHADPELTLQRDESIPDDTQDHPAPRRRSRLLVYAMSIVVLAMLASGIFVGVRVFRVNEERLSRQAMEDYKNRNFPAATEKYKKLQAWFSSSEHLDEYRMMEELCQMRGQMEDPQVPAADAFVKQRAFLDQNDKKPVLVKPFYPDLGESMKRRMEDFSGQARANDLDTPEQDKLALVKQAEQAIHDVNDLPGALAPADVVKMIQELDRVRQEIARWKLRLDYLGQIKAVAARLSGPARGQMRRLIREAEGKGLVDFSRSPEVAALLKQFQEAHLAAVIWGADKRGPQRPADPEDAWPALVVDPLVHGGRGKSDDPAVVLALARGVLYGLQRSTGKVQWAMRVGIDTTSLPVRVPKTAFSPERILVLSADTATLTALDQNSVTCWQYRLSAPCYGRPVIVEGRAFLATYDGQIDEIELDGGRLLGRFRLGEGERLTGFGARQEKSNLVYFPAEEGCVYVLDVHEKRCTAILYTDHPRRKLRGEPIIVAPEPAVAGRPAVPGYLILTQTLGLDETQLRVYALPVADPNAEPLPLKPEPRVRGSVFFQPYRDEEKLVMVSDAGFLGLFGIKQWGNQGPALFPVFPAGAQGFDLEPFLPASRGKTRARDGQVVNVQGDDYWVLAHGQMQRLQIAWQGKVGPRLAPVWKDPLLLGSPLHECQVEEDPATGRSTLIVVTRAVQQAQCLATAVDDEEGRRLWQRGLGYVCQGEPLLLQPPDGKGLPLLLAMDQGGALMSFDPALYQRDLHAPLALALGCVPLTPDQAHAPRQDLGQWQSGGQSVADAFESSRFAPLLLRDESGQAAWQITCTGDGQNLVLRRVVWSDTGRDLKLRGEVRVQLDNGVLAGPPVRLGNTLLVPLDNGDLGRVPLPDDKVRLADVQLQLTLGFAWRARRLGPETPGYVLPLEGDRFLTSNGLDGIYCWNWPVGRDFAALPPRQAPKRGGELEPTLRLKSRLASPPLLLPGLGQARPRVCLAETSGTVGLVELQKDGSLKPVRAWDLKGRVTGGPFLPALPDGSQRIGCVVDHTRLVWLDPEQAEPLWEYPGTGKPIESKLVGQPQMAGNVLVVADQAGRFVGLDPTTGKPHSLDFTLRGKMAAVASPAPFGPGLAFAPLSDGTVLLLPLKSGPKP